jgi:membrane protease YdiL (CAAX protease family)
VSEKRPTNPEIEPLTRVQVLVAMAVTAILLLVVAKLWLYFSSGFRLPWQFGGQAIAQGVAVGLGISGTSAIVYRLWPDYRRCADFYLKIVLDPLIWPDLIWLGLLPGLSEELLFRGVLLPAIGLNANGLIVTSICFGILHLSSLQQWPYMVWATIVGLVLGGSALLTGNLLVPIVAHVLTNLISSILWKFGQLQDSDNRFS